MRQSSYRGNTRRNWSSNSRNPNCYRATTLRGNAPSRHSLACHSRVCARRGTQLWAVLQDRPPHETYVDWHRVSPRHDNKPRCDRGHNHAPNTRKYVHRHLPSYVLRNKRRFYPHHNHSSCALRRTHVVPKWAVQPSPMLTA